MEALKLVHYESMPQPRQIAFNDFWRVCCRRVGKGDAEKAWAKACRLTPPELILEAMEEYAGACQETGQEARYIPHPSTWLNGRRWEDDWDEWWGRDLGKREAWRRKKEALAYWATLTPDEQKETVDSIMAIVRMRAEYDPIRQAWERDHAAGRCERFAVEAHKRKGTK